MPEENKSKSINKIMVGMSLGETACSLYNKSVNDYYHDPKVMSEVEISVYEEFGCDGVSASMGLRGMAEAFGSKVSYKDNSLSTIGKPVVEKIDDIGKLKVPDPTKDGRLPVILEALSIIKDKLNGQVGISTQLTGPFSVALNTCGAENILKWTVKYPEEVKKLLEIIVEANNRFVEEAKKLDIGFGFSDPVSSTTLLSYKQYKEFSYPYFKKNVDYIIKETDKRPSLHICGNSGGIWNDIADSGVSSFSVDNVEDIGELKKTVGDRIRIVGNIPPVDVISNGTFEDIDRSLKECILKAWDSPMGYTIAPGCQIPYGTDRKNIKYYGDRARELSKLPLDFELLNSIKE